MAVTTKTKRQVFTLEQHNIISEIVASEVSAAPQDHDRKLRQDVRMCQWVLAGADAQADRVTQGFATTMRRRWPADMVMFRRSVRREAV
jgi:hypothetical protein